MVMFFCVLMTGTALAHKVRVFAYEESGAIVGETAFSGGRPAKEAEILVRDAAAGALLTTTRTDEKGAFRFQIPEQARRDHLALRIIVNAGEGHRGEWVLAADEYLPAVDEGLVPPDSKSISGTGTVEIADNGSDHPGKAAKQAVSMDETVLRRVVEEAVEKKLGPVKHMLAAAMDHGPRLQDILGGIGYLIGIAGIVAYFKSKSSRNTNNR
jgi:nickel transport protein